jgi:predicted nucleic acid-binding protein
LAVVNWLLDTGPLVAYLDATDSQHARVAPTLDAFNGQLVTSGAVITEAMFLLADTHHGPRLLAEFIGSSDTLVYDLAQPPELEAAVSLTERYSDTPMDYADATLVLLGEALSLTTVLTLDRRGFATYRTRSRKAFKLALG